MSKIGRKYVITVGLSPIIAANSAKALFLIQVNSRRQHSLAEKAQYIIETVVFCRKTHFKLITLSFDLSLMY